MKRCTWSANSHRTVFRVFAFSQDITMLKKRFISAFPEIETISQNLVRKVRPKIMKNWIFNEKVHLIRITSEPFYAFSQDITMLKKWFISAFPEIEKISQNLGPKLGQTLWQIESLMKRCIGSTKPHRTVFRFFTRYCDAEEEIHKRISWNWENISKSGPKVRPNNMKNWIFNEKLHLTRITSEPFYAFSQDITMLKKWFISAFPETEKISQNLGQS